MNISESEKSKENIVIIAPTSSCKGRVRLNKLCELINASYDLKIEYWGWNRDKFTTEEEHSYVKREFLVSGGGEANKKLAWRYILYMAKVGKKTLWNKNQNYYCLGLESALPIYFINIFKSKSKKKNYIFDNADSFAFRFKLPNILTDFIMKIENRVAEKSTVHIIPGESRVKYYENVTSNKVVKNIPSERNLSKAYNIYIEEELLKFKDLQDYFLIYVNGYLTDDRGLEQILNLAKSLEGKKVKFLVAGKLISEHAKHLIALDNVKYFGVLLNEEALSLYFNADVCMTYYNPTKKINRLAEPNKWGDCYATNTKFIFNCEIESFRYFYDQSLGYCSPYEDKEALLSLVNKLREIKKNIDIPFSTLRTWESEMEPVIDYFIGKD